MGRRRLLHFGRCVLICGSNHAFTIAGGSGIRRLLRDVWCYRMSTMRTVIVVLLMAAACTDEELPPPPTCAEIGAPDELACNPGGLCLWQGMDCCNAPAPRSDADERCVGVFDAQPR